MSNIPHANKYSKNHNNQAQTAQHRTTAPNSNAGEDQHSTGFWVLLALAVIGILIFVPKLLVYGLIGLFVIGLLTFL